MAKNRYVTENTQESATAAEKAFAPHREGFIKSLGGPEAMLTVYRVGDVTPGKYQSFSLDPSRLGFFEAKSGAKPKAYQVRARDVAFPGSHGDLELVINSSLIKGGK